MSEIPLRSTGKHAAQLRKVVAASKPDTRFLPIIERAGAMNGVVGSRLTAAVVYGAHPSKKKPGVIEIMPIERDPYAHVEDPYFSPHAKTRDELLKQMSARRSGGDGFAVPSYVVTNGSGPSNLFMEATPSANAIPTEGLRSAAIAYEIGSVVVGSSTVIGEVVPVNFRQTSLPGLVRDLGQTILHMPEKDRMSALRHTIESHAAGVSPDISGKFRFTRPKSR